MVEVLELSNRDSGMTSEAWPGQTTRLPDYQGGNPEMGPLIKAGWANHRGIGQEWAEVNTRNIRQGTRTYQTDLPTENPGSCSRSCCGWCLETRVGPGNKCQTTTPDSGELNGLGAS